MGEVYRARDSKLRREVAIKVLPEALAQDTDALARFEREALAVAALSHPNILSIFDFGSHEGIAFAVTELLEGQTLRDVLKAGPVSPKQIVSFALQIAKGLSAAHEKGIVHRDLKPENLFVSLGGHLKILDFGLVRRSSSPGEEVTSATTENQFTEPGTVMGTVGYMSPEQVRGARVDARSDLFSFGAILYELLSGKRAFSRGSSAETMAAILRDEPPDLADSGRTYAPALESIARRCLEKEPEKRFPSAQEVVLALEELSFPSSAPVVAQAPGRSRPRKRSLLTAAVLLLLAGGGGFLVLRMRGGLDRPAGDANPASPVPSIAVLPFANLNAEKDQDYFSDGLSEEMIGLLTKVQGLRVAGRVSSFSFKGKNEDLPTIGQKLNVSAVLEGSVRRAGDRIRVSARLLKVADGFQLWAETYDRKVEDVFAVQDEIAGAVVAALKLKLLPQERPPSSQHRTSNVEAYNQYLQGRQVYNKGNPDGYRKAAAAYEKAVQLDPEFAAAYAALSFSLAQSADFAQSFEEQAEIQRKAVWAAERAVALDPVLAEAYSARANVRTYISRDWSGAQADFDKAFSLDPRDASAYFFHGRFLARFGRLQEAIAACRKAIELDPLWIGPRSPLGSYLNGAGELAEARKVLTRTLEMAPDNEWARHFLGMTCLLEGKPGEALSLAVPANTMLRRTMVALAEHDLGHEKEARAALDELIAKHAQTAAFHIALVYARRGDADRAFEWLDRAVDQRGSQTGGLKSSPILAPLRGDPRFREILRKLKLPEEP
jgi:TolB-like protein/Flp pilus assembly protein TadD